MMQAEPSADLPGLVLPALVLRHADTHGSEVAIRQKRGDGWHDLTWSDYARRVRDCAAGISALGIASPLHAGILADNSIEWLIAQMATGVLGGVSVGCYPTSSTHDLLHVLGLADAQVLFCENDDYLAKIEPIRDQLTKLQWIVMFDGASAAAGRDGIITLAELEQRGRNALQQAPTLLDASLAALSLDDTGLIVYTSGSTGAPKAAMLTYRNMRTTVQGFSAILDYGPDAAVLSYLPLCHIAEQAMTNFAPLYCRSTAVIGGGLPTLSEDILEARPTYFSGVPRVWLRFQEQIRNSFAAEGRSGELDAALEAGKPVAFKPEAEWTQAQRNAVEDHAPVMAQALAMIGMDRAGVVTSGAASLPVEVLTFFRALGLNLLELYGQTESCSIMTIHRPGRVVPGTVGEPTPTIALKIADDGEILVKGGSIFTGYYKNPEATASTIVDGWLHTGDVGVIDAGQLRIVDRKKDIMITDGGKNISPAEIEELMRSSPLIAECVLVADGRKFASALIQIDPAGFADGGALPTYEAAVAAAQVIASVTAEIRRLNETLSRVAQIKRSYILPQALKHDQGELTPTLKLRRFMVHKRYNDEIEMIYTGKLGFDVYPPSSRQ
ncbi:MAG: long-chain fatty acid--CoA ligase [Sphingomonadaceae bacterium]|nr:long-chain fatty acid--CoA ligase [Sphingomonadaceae bacterium]